MIHQATDNEAGNLSAGWIQFRPQSSAPPPHYYENLPTSVPKADKLVVLVDFKARTGTDCAAWRRMLGLHGIAGYKEHWLPILRACGEHRLLLANIFCQPMCKKATWMQLDYVLLRRRDWKGVIATKAVCDADDWTDHRLVIFIPSQDLLYVR
nr:unnamed protein product [Spirometra erinaceieuropaei]